MNSVQMQVFIERIHGINGGCSGLPRLIDAGQLPILLVDVGLPYQRFLSGVWNLFFYFSIYWE